jgi:hypothetical protein
MGHVTFMGVRKNAFGCSVANSEMKSPLRIRGADVRIILKWADILVRDYVF